ncbi:MAG: hypothetical protein KIT33_10430 [Candidatus Kapabacteria bacterium]|nr:hypothetical protein [Ignavibacteriota bacterium]MCW5885375.1 hypothetical protein [Candidatus Kapabacteria bacterium]
MTTEDRAYYNDLLKRMKIADADTFVFLSSDYVVLVIRDASEVFFNESEPNLAKVCADKGELFVFLSNNDISIEENRIKFSELSNKALETRLELGCSPKVFILDSEKHLAAMERIESDWGYMWEFLPKLLRSEAEYEQFMVEVKQTIEKQEECEKKRNEQRIITLQQFSDQCQEVLGKPIDIDNFLIN